METLKNKDTKYYVHSIIGIALMFGIPLLPPVEPITHIGMQLGGIFIGLIYLWSTVGLFWPSLLGLVAFAFTDYIDLFGVLSSFSNYMALLVLFFLIFIGAVTESGLAKYLARWILTRKIITGRPAVFTFLYMFAMWVVSAFIDGFVAMLVMWPAMYIIFEEVGYDRNDRYCKIMVLATFMAVIMGEAALPFWGAQLIIMGAFEAASGIAFDYANYMIFSISFSFIVMVLLTLLIKFVLRPDMSKMAAVDPELMAKEPLDPMNTKQKLYIASMVALLVVALGPTLLPADWAITQFLTDLDTLGYVIFVIALFSFIKIDGEPVLDPVAVCKEYVSWDLYLLVVVCMFVSGCLLGDATGIREWLVGILTPLFSGKGVMFFAVVLIVLGNLITNVANNAITGAVFVQLIVAMTPALGIANPNALAVVVTMSINLALLAPSASMAAAMLHSNRDKVSMGDILKYGSIMLVVTLAVLIFIGLPMANALFVS